MLKVLIVEDEEIIRKGLVFSINWLSMDCIVAGAAKDGAEGLEMIARCRPDVVLADIRMPKLTGLEMIEEGLKVHDFFSILLTSYSDFEFARQAVHIGVSDYLLKPVDEEELAQAMEKIRMKVQKRDTYRKIEEISQSRVIAEHADWQIFKMAEQSIDIYVKRTYEMIRQQYKEKLGINQVAEELNVSPSFLSRRIKAELNTTFVDILNQYRIREAIRLLEKGTMRIYEISDDVGFSEYKYFCAVFKRYTGTSPTEFVKNGGGAVLK